MAHADNVRQRQLDRAHAAGERWRELTDRRAETVRLLKMGGPQQADSPARVERYLAREAAKRMAYARAGVTEAFFAERRIGPTLDLDDYPPNEAARFAGTPVGRIVELDDRGTVRDGFATGFLIAPDLMITNHHVFAAAEECRGCGIQFGYEKAADGSLRAGVVFKLDTNRFFYAIEKHDFAIVGVTSTAIAGSYNIRQFKPLPLIPTTGKILVGQAISIIQYPDGGPKKYGVRDNELLIAPSDADLFLQYTTDTLPGSSGSPAFNKDWEVVALHHSGVPEIKDGQIMTIRGIPWAKGMPDSDIHWVANEGVRVSSICAQLAAATVRADYQPALADLLRTFGDDFTKLAAIQSQTEGTRMDAVAPRNDRGVAIVVNGTANFYFGGEPAADKPQPIIPISPPPTAVEKKLRFDPDYDHRAGYDPGFLSVPVPPPEISPARSAEILKDQNRPFVLKYHHYSVVMNAQRRLQMWSAVNVDYTPSKRRKNREEFGTDTWVADPRIPGKLQIEDAELYQPATKFDRGHIVRRDDTAWGDTAEEEILANSDSFHWTNCTPQHEQFNRDKYGFHGLWGGLENRIQTQAKNVGYKMSIFAGPILDNTNDIEHDFGGGLVKIPRRFWKVLLVTEDAGTARPKLRAFGFILDQTQAINKFGIERFSAGNFETYQVTLQDIMTDTGVTFKQEVLDADAMQGVREESRRTRLESLADVRI
jgi:endonuclease G, mitochondrial